MNPDRFRLSKWDVRRAGCLYKHGSTHLPAPIHIHGLHFLSSYWLQAGGEWRRRRRRRKNETINQSSPASCVCVQAVTQRSGEELRKMQKWLMRLGRLPIDPEGSHHWCDKKNGGGGKRLFDCSVNASPIMSGPFLYIQSGSGRADCWWQPIIYSDDMCVYNRPLRAPYWLPLGASSIRKKPFIILRGISSFFSFVLCLLGFCWVDKWGQQADEVINYLETCKDMMFLLSFRFFSFVAALVVRHSVRLDAYIWNTLRKERKKNKISKYLWNVECKIVAFVMLLLFRFFFLEGPTSDPATELD